MFSGTRYLGDSVRNFIISAARYVEIFKFAHGSSDPLGEVPGKFSEGSGGF